MSRYMTVKTQFKDEEALVSALMETGNWAATKIERHDVPQHLKGYKGDVRPETANLIIRAKHVGSNSNDLGFVKSEDGCYEAIVSAYDKTKYGNAWVATLRQSYIFHSLSRQQRQRGRSVNRERLPGGKQRITISGYR